MRYSNLERQEAMLMAWIPSSLINFLMRSHHTDKNSTNNTTDDDFLPLALPLLQPVKDITSDLLSQCPDICFSIVQNSDIYWKPSVHIQVPRSHPHVRTHTCVNPGSSLARSEEGRKSPFTGVWFCLKSPALFIVIKVPPTIPPLLKIPQPYIILISAESRERRPKQGPKFVQSVEVKNEEEGDHHREKTCCGLQWFLWPYKCQWKSQQCSILVGSHTPMQMIGVPTRTLNQTRMATLKSVCTIFPNRHFIAPFLVVFLSYPAFSLGKEHH